MWLASSWNLTKGRGRATPTHRLTSSGGQLSLPTCVFVVNVRDNTARYAWIAEPVAEPARATVKFHHDPTFHDLDDAAVAEIAGRVGAYYDVMPQQLLTTG